MTVFDGLEGILDCEKLPLELERKQVLEDAKKKAEHIVEATRK